MAILPSRIKKWVLAKIHLSRMVREFSSRLPSDVVRQVQNLRRDAGLAVEDRIRIFWDLDGEIAVAMGKFQTYFCTETLTKYIVDEFREGDYHSIINIRNQQIKIGIEKI